MIFKVSLKGLLNFIAGLLKQEKEGMVGLLPQPPLFLQLLLQLLLDFPNHLLHFASVLVPDLLLCFQLTIHFV
jgi:hypothetical protein